ncbi:GntR family transcriptional regulator [Pigmentiphaga kullae]|uniref:GntR family transcriptional regulator of vanillate catabolism n=1 Tax=Pigmentiphaga kullae TaxID=151784 RepID=A0A4Q7NA84_9BURK|nr:GntR family transcriptional regulator [Pigmentiphaga kullae]RZS78944.1 GntR family transcriptional regulator of vanillate catabolism [Pigmentiphaga kullae]
MATQIHTVAGELRRRIMSGAYPPGERLVELQLAADLGVSRTPIRLAFEELVKEGLLERLPTRGFRVKAVDLDDLANALDVRGALEGMAARLVAEQGAPPDVMQSLRDCVEEGWNLLEDAAGSGYRVETPRWSAMNEKFHAILIQAAGNPPLASALAHVSQIPLVGAAVLGLGLDDTMPQPEYAYIHRAQQDHDDIVAAIELGEGARAESLMREHVRRSRDNKRRIYQLRVDALRRPSR